MATYSVLQSWVRQCLKTIDALAALSMLGGFETKKWRRQNLKSFAQFCKIKKHVQIFINLYYNINLRIFGSFFSENYNTISNDCIFYVQIDYF